MERRNFLKIAGVGSVATVIGSGLFRVSGWWDQVPASSKKILSEGEITIVEAILDAMFPGDSEAYRKTNRLPNGRETDAVRYFDSYVSRLDERSANLMRLLLHAIDEVAFFRGLKFKRFRNRNREDRIAILRAWDESNLGIRRSAFRAMKLALSGGYMNSKQVRQAAGVRFACSSSNGRRPTAMNDEGTAP